MNKLPHIKKPCRDCPFRQDTLKGWLGRERMADILEADSFACHKKPDMQCAGHMLMKGDDNAFVRLAGRMRLPLDLSGGDTVFQSHEACVDHHGR